MTFGFTTFTWPRTVRARPVAVSADPIAAQQAPPLDLQAVLRRDRREARGLEVDVGVTRRAVHLRRARAARTACTATRE